MTTSLAPYRIPLLAAALALGVAGCSSAGSPAAAPASPPATSAAPAATAPAEPPGTPPPPAPRATASPTPTATAGVTWDGDRVTVPGGAADLLVRAWQARDREAARRVASGDVVAELWRERPFGETPRGTACPLHEPGVFLCGYPLAPHAELTLRVEGGASAGYRVTALEWGD